MCGCVMHASLFSVGADHLKLSQFMHIITYRDHFVSAKVTWFMKRVYVLYICSVGGTVVSRYYDTAGIRKKYHDIQSIELSSTNF